MYALSANLRIWTTSGPDILCLIVFPSTRYCAFSLRNLRVEDTRREITSENRRQRASAGDCRQPDIWGKVGDTLNAIVLGGAGTYKYEWSVNGIVSGTKETFEIPASAKSGDRIKVTVTDEEGNTAEDTVYVGGFSIVMVEPTTDAQTGLGGNGYKYIRAYFSTGLDSLEADDIEISAKKNNQLFSVDTVKLSADGTYADITLFGSIQEGNTKFLDPATIYTMAITKDGITATYEFELPANASDEIVTAVDVENSTITVVPSGRSNAGTVDGEFAIGDVYAGNLSELVGRTVNIGTNSDNEIVKISVNEEAVVTGKMTYRQGDKADAVNADVSVLKDSYFEDALTGAKYYFSSTNTSNVN